MPSVISWQSADFFAVGVSGSVARISGEVFIAHGAFCVVVRVPAKQFVALGAFSIIHPACFYPGMFIAS